MTSNEMGLEMELKYREQQLRARDGKPGYKANCEALKARIAELKAAMQPAVDTGKET